MIHKFKLYGQRFAIDTESLAVHKLSELQYDMLTYLRLPFEDAFPSTLRYDLAKYESSKLSEGYLALAKLSIDGVFMSDSPVTVSATTKASRSADKSFECDERKFVFATEVIKAADNGSKLLSVTENASAPVRVSDYDIFLSEYERVAKEIIKRKTGRIPGDVFEFLPFDIPFANDDNGYVHIADASFRELLENENESVGKKLAECAVAVYFADKEI